eukprot:803173-Rhodomonas_salina.1
MVCACAGRQGCAQLSFALGTMSQVEELYLGNCHIDNTACVALSVGLRLCPSLRRLDLANAIPRWTVPGRNTVGDSGVDALIPALKYTTALEVSGNCTLNPRSNAMSELAPCIDARTASSQSVREQIDPGCGAQASEGSEVPGEASRGQPDPQCHLRAPGAALDTQHACHTMLHAGMLHAAMLPFLWIDGCSCIELDVVESGSADVAAVLCSSRWSGE